MEMPEKIYAMESGVGYSASKICYAGDTEYIREDLVPQWISVEDRLPEEDDHDQNGYVFVMTDDFVAMYDCYDSGDGILKGEWETFGDTVTHWMPIPPLEQE